MEQPINILIVDDEPKNLTVIEAILSDPSYTLMRANSAEEALMALLVEDFALLILDVRMPGMTGFELANIVKERKKTARVPIIFLTAYYNEDGHVLEGYGSGAVDYLHKPVNPAALRSKAAVFAELHRKQRAGENSNRALLAEVTERQRAERELKELNATLANTVAERTQALDSLKISEQRLESLLAQSQTLQRQLRELSREVLMAHEEERNRISKVLQEVVGQDLGDISLSLGKLKLDGTAPSLRESIAQIHKLVAKSAETVNDFSRELRPAMLDHGLIPSLRSYLQNFGDRAGFRVSMIASAGVEELECSMRTALYRVAQEALTNVALHAKATRVDVVIQPRDGGIAMEIKDDGQGFLVNEDTLRPGLLGVRERVEMFGGRFFVESAPGKPTILRVQFPGKRALPH